MIDLKPDPKPQRGIRSRLLAWLGAFDSALDHDPTEQVISSLNRRVSELEQTVSILRQRQNRDRIRIR